MRILVIAALLLGPIGLAHAASRDTTVPAPTEDGDGATEAATRPQQVEVLNFPATQNVSGQVDVLNLPAVQTVSGSVSMLNLPLDANGDVRVSGENPTVGHDEFLTLLAGDGCQTTEGTSRAYFHDFPAGGPWRRLVFSVTAGVQAQTAHSPILYFTAAQFAMPTYQGCFDTALMVPQFQSCPYGNQAPFGVVCSAEPVGNRLVIIYSPPSDGTPTYVFLRWER